MFSKPSRTRFAKQILDALRQYEPGRQLELDREDYILFDPEGARRIASQNVYDEHCSLSRKDRPAHLQRLAQTFSVGWLEDLPDSFEDANQHLRPKVWCRSAFSMIELRKQVERQGEIPDIPLYPLGSHLYSSLVYDTELSMRSVSTQDLESWDTTYYEAMEIACQNLAEDKIAYARIGDGFPTATSGDNYDSSGVLLIDRIRSMKVKGQHIAMIPQRDEMFVAGSEDEVSLAIMFELTAKAMNEEPRPLSPVPLILGDGEWQDWTLAENHRLKPKLEELELYFLGGLYDQQHSLLDSLNERGDLESSPASFSAIQERGSERKHSYCVWSRGVDSLLPRSQNIVFVDDTGSLASGRWDHVHGIVGELIV